jgi:hypothetical protein
MKNAEATFDHVPAQLRPAMLESKKKGVTMPSRAKHRSERWKDRRDQPGGRHGRVNDRDDLLSKVTTFRGR